MLRALCHSLLTIAIVSSATFGQDGPLRRAGRALDNAGRNIRTRVETEVVRGQVTAQERDVLYRVTRRIEWDKQFVGSTIQLDSQPGGSVVLRGSVRDELVRTRLVDLVQNTIGVSRVVDELGIVKTVKVIETRPGATVIESSPSSTVIETRPPSTVIESRPPSAVIESKPDDDSTIELEPPLTTPSEKKVKP
ncbi:BON domain-containing protein [Singulisphaera rosea]